MKRKSLKQPQALLTPPHPNTPLTPLPPHHRPPYSSNTPDTDRGGTRHCWGAGCPPSAANGKPPAASVQPIGTWKAVARLCPTGCRGMPAVQPPAPLVFALCDNFSPSSRRVALRPLPLPTATFPVSEDGRREVGPSRPIGAVSAVVTEGAVARVLP